MRAIFTNELGWFDGRAEDLYRLPHGVEARKTLESMGGIDKVGGQDRLGWRVGGSCTARRLVGGFMLCLSESREVAVRMPPMRAAGRF